MSIQPRLAALFVALTSSFLFTTAAAARPNIVFIMVDDLDMSVWNEALKLGVLPNIKSKLIDRGTTFEQMFVSQPLCCPSRATLHTGQYPQNHGVAGNDQGLPGNNEGYYDQFKSLSEPKALATWLKQTGSDGFTYRTGHFGKYMNGSGFAYRYVPPGWDVWRTIIPKSPEYCQYGYTLANTGGEPQTFGGAESDFMTDKLAELAVEFIGASDPRPFFLMVTPTAPHIESCRPGTVYHDPNYEIRTAPRYVGQTPQVALPDAAWPSFDEADMSDKPEWMQEIPPANPVYLQARTKLFNEKIAALRPVDDLVKRVLDALAAQSKISNRASLVIFTSDNGHQYGTHRLRGKEDFYEESIRVPMVIRLPGQKTPRTQQAWVMNNDWAPTIADYAGVKRLMKVDGRSLRPLLQSATATSPRQTILIRTGLNPGVPVTGPVPPNEGNSHHPFQAVRTRQPALTGDATGNTILVYAQTYNYDETLHAEELYDLAVDPYQINSLHGSTNPARLAQINRLRQRLDKMKSCSGEGCRHFEDD